MYKVIIEQEGDGVYGRIIMDYDDWDSACNLMGEILDRVKNVTITIEVKKEDK